MAEIAGAVKEGLLAPAVSTGLQIMTAMSDQDVAWLCGPHGKHNPDRAGYWHGTEAGSVTWMASTMLRRRWRPVAPG